MSSTEEMQAWLDQYGPQGPEEAYGKCLEYFQTRPPCCCGLLCCWLPCGGSVEGRIPICFLSGMRQECFGNFWV